MTEPSENAPAPPAVVRIVVGQPTAEELAAVQAVISAVVAERSTRGAELLAPPVDHWARSGRAMRQPLAPGAGAWGAGARGAPGGTRGF